MHLFTKEIRNINHIGMTLKSKLKNIYLDKWTPVSAKYLNFFGTPSNIVHQTNHK